MNRKPKASQKKEKFKSNIFELINYFEFEPFLQLPYAYFRCDFSELESECFSSRFFRLNLESGEVDCVDSETLIECGTPYCCSVITNIKEICKTEEVNG